MNPQLRYQPGDKIGGRYQVHQALMGGMGEVYLCLDLETIQPFALKTFQQRYQTNAQRLRRAFEKEVSTWVALEKHPNIVRCFYMDTLDNQPFMVLEWIAGEEGKGTNLRSWLRRDPLDLRLALDFTIDICRGLIHAQEKQPGLVHRDLKPENILVAQGGLAKVTDFGLAEIIQEAGLEMDAAGVEMDGRQSIVGRKGIVGTPPYMAPEQWRGESLDQRTDIYALGCMLYEMLTGECPFQVDFEPTTLRQFQQWLSAMQARHESGRLSPLPASFPAGPGDLLQGCLAKAKAERPASLSELLSQLEGLYRQQFTTTPRASPTVKQFIAEDYYNRGMTYTNLIRYDEALRDYNRAIELDPNFAPGYVGRGATYSNLQRHDEALRDYNRAIDLDPNYVPAYSNRGITYHELQRYDEALRDYRRAIDLDPNNAPVYSNRGITYRKLQRHDEALRDYRRAIDLDPNNAPAYTNRGITYRELQRYDEALRDFNRAIDLAPNDATAYTNRGVTYSDLQRYDEALRDLNRAIDLDPNDATVYSNRGATYSDLQRYDEALRDHSQAIKLDPNFARAYSNRGITYRKLQRHDEALRDYRRAIELDPSYAKAYTNRGITYRELQRYDEALRDYSKAIELDPNDATAYYNRGNTYAALQHHDEALRDYSRTIELDPNYVPAYINRGNTYAALQHHDEALRDYSWVIELDPNLAPTYDNRGLTYAALQRYDDALRDFSRAIELDPNYAPAYYNLGALLGNQGQLREALHYFEKAAKLGNAQGARYATQVRRMLGMDPTPQIDPAQQAFEALQRAGTAEEMQQAVTRFPFMMQADFIAAIEQAIAQQVPPEHRPACEQRLAWLRQIASEQKRGKE